jgi:hypothetical protein
MRAAKPKPKPKPTVESPRRHAVHEFAERLYYDARVRTDPLQRAMRRRLGTTRGR